jgi:hypothetical protein
MEILACFGLGIVVGLVPWVFRNRFYFHDDMQHQHMPIFVHIGRMLRAGEPPFLTLASFTSGNLLGEYQFALLNPVSLVLYALLPSFNDLETAALFLACFYYGVLAAGAYVLARTYAVDKAAAAVAALVIASNNLICYWFAASWFPIFVSIAWFVWAWAFLARAGRSRLDWLLAVVFSYLTITSGWPQTTIVLGLVGLVIAVQHWRTDGLRRGALVIAAVAAAGLLSATTLLGLAAVGEVAARYRGVSNNNVLVPNLRDLLALSSPFHRGFMSWGGYKLTGAPIFHLAWFIVPLLPLLRWRLVEWRPDLLALAAMAGLSLLLTQGPEELYMVRWPFRWIPYLHIAVAVLFLAIVSREGFAPASPRRVGAALLLVLLSAVASLQADPAAWPHHLAAIGIGVVAVAVFIAIPERRRTMRIGWLGAVSLLFFAATHALFPMNTDIPDYGLPAEVEPGLRANSAPTAYSLYVGGIGNAADPGRLDEFRTGMMPRVRETATINGYTPIGHRFGSELLCMNMFGEACFELGPRLFERDPRTGARYVDLLRIDRLIAHRGPHLDRLRPFLGPAWRLEFNGPRTQRFVRTLPNAGLPGTASWASPGVVLTGTGPVRASSEVLRIAPAARQSPTIVFARLWWPGYEAKFNGESVPVRAHGGVFVAVDLPAISEAGTLTLSFRPPYFWLGLGAVAIGLLVIFMVLAFPRLGGFPDRWRTEYRPRRQALRPG